MSFLHDPKIKFTVFVADCLLIQGAQFFLLNPIFRRIRIGVVREIMNRKLCGRDDEKIVIVKHEVDMLTVLDTTIVDRDADGNLFKDSVQKFVSSVCSAFFTHQLPHLFYRDKKGVLTADHLPLLLSDADGDTVFPELRSN